MSNPQRKGQWLINEIRKNFDYTKITTNEQEKMAIENVLWNMSNDRFEAIMERWQTVEKEGSLK